MKILSSTEHSPGSETSLAIDTEGVPGRGPDPVTGDDPTTATIYYQVTGGGSSVEIFRTRVSLEIGNDQDPDSNPAYSVVLGEKLYGTGLQTTWDGKGTGNQPYGVWNAQIKVDVDFDETMPEPEAQEWEQTYRSGFLPITVYSYPVTDAGVDQAVLLDPVTNSVEVSFNGSGSIDLDAIGASPAITNYSWSFSAPNPADAGTPSSVTSAQPAATTTYYTPGVKTVTLTVTDNDSQPLDDQDTVVVKVVKLTPVFTPMDNFVGRSHSRFAIAEEMELSFTAEPPVDPTDVAKVGGLVWTIPSGLGTLTDSKRNDGMADYVASTTPGSVTLKLAVARGSMAGNGTNSND